MHNRVVTSNKADRERKKGTTKDEKKICIRVNSVRQWIMGFCDSSKKEIKSIQNYANK